MTGTVKAPLSWGQQQMLRAMGVDAHAEHFHMTDELHIRGSLDVERLSTTLADTFANHPLLHVRIEGRDGGAMMQCFSGVRRVPCQIHDLRSSDEEAPAAALAQLRDAVHRAPFALGDGELFRYALARMRDDECVLLLAVHHLVADDWSMRILQKELAERFLGQVVSTESTADTEPSYFGFARDEHAWLASGASDAARRYWARRLSTLSGQLPLPFDRPRATLATRQRGVLRSSVPQRVVAALHQHVRSGHTTLFSLLFSAFNVLLWRLSHGKRIPVATLVANREDAGCDEAVGLFFNTLVLVADIDPERTFRGLAASTARQLREAMSYQRVPFQFLVDQHLPVRDPMRAPFTQALFALLGTPGGALRLGDVTLAQKGGIDTGAIHDIALTAFEKPDALDIVFEYDAGMFDADTIAAWQDVYMRILAQVTDYIEAPVRTLGFTARASAGQPRDAWDSAVPAGFVGQLDGCDTFARRRANGDVERLDSAVRRDTEAEDILAAFPGISRAVVTVDETHGVVAHLVHRRDGLDLGALRRELYAALPMDRVPGRFQSVPWIPEYVTGLIDVAGLWDIGRATEALSRRPPADAREAAVLALWREAIRTDDLGPDDSFFASGGNSLSAAWIVVETQRRFAVAVSVRDVFEAGTVAAFATRLNQGDVLPEAWPWYVDAREAASRWAHREADGSLSHPTSEAQARMWILDKLVGGSDRYVLKTSHRIRGPLDRNRLRAALNALTERHEQLRAVFHEVDGDVRQTILPPGAIPLAECAHDAAGQVVVRETLDTPFDLGTGPNMRALLVTTASGEDHYIHVAIHHIITDGWSMNIMMDDWLKLYDGTPGLPSLPIEYREYCSWRHSAGMLDAIANDVGYWQNQLSGAHAETPLPENRTARADRPGAGHHRFEVNPALCRRLASICGAHGTSLHTIMLAGFAVALWRYSGQSDLSIGTPVSNREREGLDRLVGLFVNTVVLRLRFGPATPLGTLMDAARDTVLDALAHATAPFDEVVHALKASRYRDGSPLFDVMFSFNEFPPVRPAVGELRLEDVPQASTDARARLACVLTMANGTAYGDLEFRADTLDPAVVAALAEDYVRILDQWSARPGALVHELAASQAHVDTPLPPAGFDPSRFSDIFSIVRQQASLTPGRIALRDHTQAYSYAEVMELTRRGATQLQARGFTAGARIGLACERSPRLILAVLAILRVGAAYSPLFVDGDAANWQEHVRIASLDAVVIDQPAAAGKLGDTAWLLLDDLLSEVATDHAPMDTVAHPLAPAVIFRTSGSTGRPKYVIVPHEGVVQLLTWAGAFYHADTYAHASFATAIGFDVSLFELLAPWTLGGTVTMMANLLDLDADEPFSMLSSTPTQVRGVLDERPIPDSIRVLNMAGEALPKTLVERVFAETGVERIVNLYGPTEASIYSSFHVMERGDGKDVRIGKPQPHVHLYVVDETLAHTPAGVSGEICIGGLGLALGYAGSPALTAEFFVPDPFATRPGARMYRTRDIGRVAPDGALDYLGRIDSVQKLRGVWVNFNELAEDVRRCSPVSDAVVCLVPASDAEDAPVIAFCVMDEGQDFDEAALRREFRERVASTRPPAYAHIISRFVAVNTLPLNANGKVDIRAVQALAPREAPATSSSEAPVGEMAQVLWQIWKNVLKVDGVATDADFFAIGGHSLMALRVLSELKTATGVTMALGTIFEFPVFSDFVAEAERLARLQANGDGPAGTDDTPLPASVIEPADRTGRLPVSFAQQRMWFMAQMEGGSEAYHIAFGLRLDGRVDQPAMQRALNTIMARHESLRTTFHFVDGELEQRIRPAQESHFPLTSHDVRAAVDWKDEVIRLSALTVLEPFDFSTGPLVRACLIQVSEDRHVMRITMHHMVSDGWSMGVMRREFGALYTAFRAGAPDPLPPLPIQHVDYVVWQRKWMDSEVMRRQAEYWRNNLAGAPATLDLPTDRPRPTHPRYTGNVVHFAIDEELSESLRLLGRRHGATPYMTLLAGWGILLARLSGQDDVLIGSPVANRIRAETEGLIGFFANNLVLRLHLEGRPTVVDVIRQARKQALSAQSNQDIPFEQVVEISQPLRSLSHSPLFQVMFAWQNMPRGKESELSGLKTGRLRSRTPRVSSRFDMTLSLFDQNGRIVGGAEYSTALFDSETITRYLEYYRHILRAMVANEDLPVEQLDMLGPDQREQLVDAWNRTSATFPADVHLHQPFERQAARSPEAVALYSGNTTLTYGELDRAAEGIAHRLVAMGVGPGSRVGICASRGFAPVKAMLGVLKAGAAYVPLDPSYPPERLAFVIDDCTPAAVLVDDMNIATVAAMLNGVPYVSIDGEIGPAPRGGSQARHAAAANDLAYVIYTSGSTGRPKGVMIEHRSVLNTIHDINERYGVRAGDRVLALSSVAFDLSVYDIFGLLAAGGAVVLPPPENVPDPERWLGIMADKRVTVWNTVPALMQLLVDAAEAANAALDHVRVVMLSGDWVPAALVARVRAVMPQAAVYSLGGATEGSIWSIAHQATDLRGAMVPYGRPIANQHMYVLDRAGEPCPPGVVGELHIGGTGVARGYFGRPRLTAARFVPDHLSGAHGAMLYRTGDLGRWLSDGTIEFLGRNDSQVKIRGFRVELGEIEARLREHPDLRDVAVAVRDEHGTGPRLVAYVVNHEGRPMPSTIDMHALVARTLPDYMLPTAYVAMPALPLSPNGKVARDQLPSPDDGGVATGHREPPLPGIETILAGIWAELLQTAHITRMDNFFRLGGHSLLVMRVVVAVRQRLGVEMRMSDLFAHPVLSDLAQVVSASSSASLPPIMPQEHGDKLPLSFAQRRLWFLCQVPEISRAYHISLGLTLDGPLDRDALRWALDRIVARHDVLRATFGFDDGEPFQRVSPENEATFALDEHDLSGLADWRDALTRLVRDDARAPFVLDAGPLVRGSLIRLGPEKHVLRLTVHHIVTDAWSMGILSRDLSVLYQAGLRGRHDTLPRPAVRYADFAQWQAKWIEGDVLSAQAAYWRKQLAGIPTLIELPTDHPRPPVQRFTGSVVDIELDKGLTLRIRELAARHGVTLHMVLLAAWAVVLARLSGQDDVVIGVPVSNRRQAETEDVIGFFLNTLAVRLSLGDHPRVQDLLAKVKAASVDALQNQDIPFERVVELIRPERSLAHSPVFQVMFQWQTRNEGHFSLDGLSVSRSRGSNNQRTVKFDITLSLYELDDRIVGGMEYASSLFLPATIERYAGYLRSILHEMTGESAQPVSRLTMLPPAESAQLLAETSPQVETRYPCIHHGFAANVRATPDAIAISFGTERLTYAELNVMARRVASGLRGRGVGRGDRVALCMDRHPALVACLLGTLMVGAAYVPLDPGFPAERLRYIVSDAAPAVILATAPNRAWLDTQTDASVLDPYALLADDTGEEGESDAGPDDLAYIIYTSGSTGRPKGVAIEHRQAANFIAWAADAFSRDELRATLFATSLNFDLAVFECLVPLTLGTEVRMVRNVLELQGDDATVTLVNTVPSAMRALLENQRIGPSVTTINLAGEALSADLVKQIFASTQVASVCNLYGPSETTTYSTWQRIERHGSNRPDIGRPIAHTRIYILDEHGQLVPQGVTGHIHIAGRGVARGYWQRPGLSADRFIPDPFAGEPGQRMYRTGDLGYWTAEGTIAFRGRNDQQVKVRGFRIEPGEIESCINEDPGVARVAVLPANGAGGNVQLVAYLVSSGTTEDTESIRRRVEAHLPDYMAPVHYMWLERLPLTPTGKLDRASLPPPPMAATVAGPYAPPEGSVEIAIGSIWCELLGVTAVGRDDNFFALGGHSLLAMRLVGAMNRRGWALGPLDIFMTPTIRGLARQVALPAPVKPAGIVRVRRTMVESPLFFVHDGTDNLQYLYMLEPHLPPSVPLIGLPAVPRDAPALPTIEAMAARLVNMMVEAFPEGPYQIAGWSIGGILAYEAAHQLLQQGREVTFVALFDTAYLRGTRLFNRLTEQEADLVVDDKVYLLQLIRSRLALQDDYERFSQALVSVQSGMEGLTLHAFLERCDAAGILPPDFAAQGSEALHHQFERQRLYIRAQLGYQAPRLPMPIHLFQAQTRASQTAMLGWSSVMAEENIRMIDVPGDHFSIMSGNNAAVTGRELAIALAVVRQPRHRDVDREGALP